MSHYGVDLGHHHVISHVHVEVYNNNDSECVHSQIVICLMTLYFIV